MKEEKNPAAPITSVPEFIDLTGSDDEAEVHGPSDRGAADDANSNPSNLYAFTRHSKRLVAKKSDASIDLSAEILPANLDTGSGERQDSPSLLSKQPEHKKVAENGISGRLISIPADYSCVSPSNERWHSKENKEDRVNEISPSPLSRTSEDSRASLPDAGPPAKKIRANSDNAKSLPTAKNVSFKKHIHRSGDRVFAGWMKSQESRGGIRWFPGKVNSDSILGSSHFGEIRTYDILFDDGDNDKSVPEAFVMAEKEYKLEIDFERSGGWEGITRKTFPCKRDDYAEKRGWFLSSILPRKAFALLSKALEETNKKKNLSQGQSLNLNPLSIPIPTGCNDNVSFGSDTEGSSDYEHDDEKLLNRSIDDNESSSDNDLFSDSSIEHNDIPRTCPKTNDHLEGDLDNGARVEIAPVEARPEKNQKKPAEKKRYKIEKSKTLITIDKFPLVLKEDKDCYYFMAKWPERIFVKHTLFSSGPPANEDISGGVKSEIVYSELVRRRGKGPSLDNMGLKYYKSYYFKTEGRGYETIDIKDVLLSIADFKTLTYNSGPQKTVARIKLLFSKASKSPDSKKYPLLHSLDKDDFELIEDQGHLGCGFIPKSFIPTLLCESKKAHTSFAIQVRFVSPSDYGIGKGVLMVKDGINKIQLPKSMIKVETSKESPLHDDVFFNIVGIFPSASCGLVERVINSSFQILSRNQRENLKLPGDSILNVMQAKGVPKDILIDYRSDAKDATKNRYNHATVVGVIDPTGYLRNETVFIPGMGHKTPRKVFITRSPCTEASDGFVTDVGQLHKMPQHVYDFFHSLNFGSIVFPLNKDNPLPPRIADGDLDGDLYFILWDEEVINSIDANNDTRDPVHDIAPDFLVGTSFQCSMQEDTSENAILYDSYVIKKLGENPDSYLVRTGPDKKNTQIMTKDEIAKGKDWIVEVVDHRLKGKGSATNTEFLVEWSDTGNDWVSACKIRSMFADPPSELLEYVYEKKLLGHKDCSWMKKHFGTAILEKIIDHRRHNGKMEVLCRYDDGMDNWEPMEEVKEDGKLHLGSYAEENKLLDVPDWSEASNFWFDTVQDLFCKEQRMNDIDFLFKLLYRMYMASYNENGPENLDTLTLGRAYKNALDIEKHGGKVKLPVHLYHCLSKRARKHVEIA